MRPEHQDVFLPLARGLAQDAGIRVRLGRRWGWQPEERVLVVDRADLERQGVPYCAALVAHEIGHFHLSRYLWLTLPEDLPRERVLQLLNTLEDPRVDRWMAARYPGIEAWQAVLRAELDPPFQRKLGRMSDWDAFLVLALFDAEAGFSFEIEDSPGVSAAVVEAFHQTRPYRRMYVEEVPTPGFQASVADWPRVRSTLSISGLRADTLKERAVLCSAWRAFDIAVREIFPRVKHLLPKADPDDPTEELSIPVPRLVPSVRFREIPGAEGTEIAVSSGRAPLESGNYQALYARVASQIARLAAELDRILLPLRQRLKSGHPSGVSLDLARAMAYDADPDTYDRLWRRRFGKRRYDTAVYLLVDLSGSMRGNKIECAQMGTVLLAETFHRVKVPFEIAGFQDRLIEIVPFGRGLCQATRRRIEQMSLEVCGECPGGNNQYGYNDDGSCLERALRRLMGFPAEERVLIVVSDGLPEGRHSGSDDLRRVIDAASRLPVHLIGLGLGEGTEHVTDFYPDSVANIPPERFVEAIAALMRRVIAG